MWHADRQEYCSTLSGRRCWTHVRLTWADSVARPCRCSWPIGVPSETHVLTQVVACSWGNLVRCRQQLSARADTVCTALELLSATTNAAQSVPVWWPEVANESRCCIHDPLQWHYGGLWKCCQQRVAVVEQWQYKRGDQTGGNVEAKQTTYLPQSSQLEKAGLCRLGDMRPHVAFRV